MAQSNFPSCDSTWGLSVHGVESPSPASDQESGDEGFVYAEEFQAIKDKLQAVNVHACLVERANKFPELEKALRLSDAIQLNVKSIYSTITTPPPLPLGPRALNAEEVKSVDRIVSEFCVRLDFVVRSILEKMRSIHQAPLLFLAKDKQKREQLGRMADEHLNTDGVGHSERKVALLFQEIQNLRAKLGLSLTKEDKKIPEKADSESEMKDSESGPEVA